jgi:hypothetical protein
MTESSNIVTALVCIESCRRTAYVHALSTILICMRVNLNFPRIDFQRMANLA